MEGKITFKGDRELNDIHHIGIEFDGNYFSVIFGKYINGGFFSIPNWNTGGELSDFSDTFWNAESIGKSLRSKKVAKEIARIIATY